MKPDLVAPGNLTSFSTPVVAAAAGLLLQHADRMVEQGTAAANRSEVVKAALLGGAVKPSKWQAGEGRPLDEHLGAGIVNVNRALSILENGPIDPGKVTSASGWAYPDLKQGETASFELQPAGDLGRVAVTAVWNRRIDGRIAQLRNKETGERLLAWLDGPRLADFDLRLVRIEDDGSEALVAASESRVDNVEHLYLPTLAAGRYRVELIRREGDTADERYEVALAWIIDPPVEETPEPPVEETEPGEDATDGGAEP